jgi:hypothetical protein
VLRFTRLGCRSYNDKAAGHETAGGHDDAFGQVHVVATSTWLTSHIPPDKKSIKAVIGALRKLCRRRPVDFFVLLGWGNREAMTRVNKSVITHFRLCREVICLY